MTRRRLAALLAVFMLPSLFYALDKWVLAALPFDWTADSASAGIAAQALSVQLPSLVLNSFVNSGERIPSLAEIQQRNLADLMLEHTSLVSALEAAIKSRDQLLVSSDSARSLRKKIKEKDALIEEARTKLQENELAIKSLKEEISGGDSDAVYSVRPELVSLWKEDSSALLQLKDDSTIESIASKEKINAVISGQITALGEYAMVQASLTLYPGGITVGTVEEIGDVSDAVSLAEGLSRQLLPLVVNSEDVSVVFNVLPEEASASAVIVMDGKIVSLAEIPQEGLVISSGVHSVTVESEGYYGKSFTWTFSGAETFVATVRLEEQSFVQLSLAEEGGVPGQVYVDALPVGTAPVEAEVSQGLILGQFVPEEESSGEDSLAPSFFTLDVEADAELEQVNARLKAETEDISARIEKRRRTMYNSYSALIVSLIPSIVSYGMYVTTYNAWALGHGDESKVRTWDIVSNVSMGLSVGLGVNFVVQLGRYIAAANAVLPDNIDLDED